MAALQYVDVKGYNAIIFRKTYMDLSQPEGLISRSHEWLTGSDAKWNAQQHRWQFPSGATLSFGYMQGPNDHYNYLGGAYQFVAFDEMVQIPKNQAMYLFSRLRRLAGTAVPIRFRGASNPPGPEQVATGQWVKDRYVDPETRKEDVVFIPAKIDDNPHLDQVDYKENLMRMESPVVIAQLLKGDWDARTKGRMFDRSSFTLINEVSELCDPMEVEWCRYWDMASTEPHKANQDPDWTVGTLMGRTPNGQYVIADLNRFRCDPGAAEERQRDTAELDGLDTFIAEEIEGGSSGKAVARHKLDHVFDGYSFHPDIVAGQGSKRQRAVPYSSAVSGGIPGQDGDAVLKGKVYLVKASWNRVFFAEHEAFPDGGAGHDDMVDSASGAFRFLSRVRPSAVAA